MISKMSKAHADKRNATVRRYLLVDLARAGLSARQWDVLAIIMDETYGWKKPGQTDHKVRRDRNLFRYEDIADRIGCSYAAVCKAMRDLINRRIVEQYQAPTKTHPGEFGIQSDTSQWVRMSDSSSPKKTNIPRHGRRGKSDIPHLQSVGMTSNSSRNVVEKLHNQAVCEVPNIDLNIEEENSVSEPGLNRPLDVDPSECFIAPPEVILDPLVALKMKLSFGDAMYQARESYHHYFSESLARWEVPDLQRFFSESQNRGVLLSAWLIALVKAETEREQKTGQGERVPERAFPRVMKLAYFEIKNAKKKRNQG